MQSELTSLWLCHKLDLPRHEVPIGQASGTWKHFAVEFEYIGHHYTATAKHDVGAEPQQCCVKIHKYGITVSVVSPPRKHYYDDDGDPQYQPPDDLWRRWLRLSCPSTFQQFGQLVMAVLNSRLSAEVFEVPTNSHTAAMALVLDTLLDDFINQGFLPAEFPLIFLETA